MRPWTKSACAVLAWSILPIILVAVGMKELPHPPQANTRIASITEITLTSMLSVVAIPVAATRPTMRYVVQPGDTLSGIAARFAVRGGWPALYAANRRVIGRDPNIIRPGTALVVPGHMTPSRYTVTPGDTLSGIAARFAVRGGWPVLYAANRRVIGRDPNIIRPGTLLTLPRSAPPSPPGPSHRRRHPSAPPAPPTGPQHHSLPVTSQSSAATGMLQWLKIMLLVVGLLIVVAVLIGLVLAVRRRRRAAAQPLQSRTAIGSGKGPDFRWPGAAAAAKAQVILADHDRLVVTRDKRDDTVCVLRPPGEDPAAILRAARLVLPEELYQELAAQLGIPLRRPEVDQGGHSYQPSARPRPPNRGDALGP
jgi:LysM repeat protein